MSKNFGDAADLYAKNYSIIQAVRIEFERDINVFLDSVRNEASSLVSSEVYERATSGYRYWWIGEAEDRDRFPQLWFESGDPKIVDPGELKLTAIAPSACADQLPALSGVGRREEFAGICQRSSGGTWSLFTALIKCGDDDAIQVVSSVTARLLVVLNDVYLTSQAALATTSCARDNLFVTGVAPESEFLDDLRGPRPHRQDPKET